MAQTIGNYVIENKLDENGPVSVYLAKHRILNRRTFLKVHSGADDNLIRRFEEEARIVADINDPHVVSIYDFGKAGDATFYIAMEYVDGGNLSEYLKNKNLSTDEILKLCHRICHSIAVIHKNNYVHRDLKPENILLTSGGDVKLTDFGLSLHVSRKRSTPKETLLGTPLYMSPEQINNADTTLASDVFSLGVIFYQIATGAHPFEADSVGEIFSQILTKKTQPLSENDYPAWFTKLVENMLNKDPRKRPPSATEVLQVFQSGLGERNTVDEKDRENDKGGSRTKVFAVAAFIILVAVLAIPLVKDLIQKPDEAVLSPVDSLKDTTTVSDTTKMMQQSQPLAQENGQAEPQITNQNAADTTKASGGNNEPTRIFVRTTPWCKIYIDYEYVDTTPMSDTLKIEPGTHTIGLINKEYPSWVEQIEVVSGRDNIFSFNLDSIFYKLDLKVHPYGKVYIDDRLVGTTPFSSPLVLNKNNKILRVEHDAYETYYDSLKWNGQPVISKRVILSEKKTN